MLSKLVKMDMFEGKYRDLSSVAVVQLQCWTANSQLAKVGPSEKKNRPTTALSRKLTLVPPNETKRPSVHILSCLRMADRESSPDSRCELSALCSIGREMAHAQMALGLLPFSQIDACCSGAISLKQAILVTFSTIGLLGLSEINSDVAAIAVGGQTLLDLAMRTNPQKLWTCSPNLNELSETLLSVICLKLFYFNPDIGCICLKLDDLPYQFKIHSSGQAWCRFVAKSVTLLKLHVEPRLCLKLANLGCIRWQFGSASIDFLRLMGISENSSLCREQIYSLLERTLAVFEMRGSLAELLGGCPLDDIGGLFCCQGLHPGLGTFPIVDRLTFGPSTCLKEDGSLPLMRLPLSPSKRDTSLRVPLRSTLQLSVLDPSLFMGHNSWCLSPSFSKVACFAFPLVGALVNTTFQLRPVVVYIGETSLSRVASLVIEVGPAAPFFRCGIKLCVRFGSLPRLVQTSRPSPISGYNYLPTSGGFAFFSGATVPSVVEVPSGIYIPVKEGCGSYLVADLDASSYLWIDYIYHGEANAFLQIGSSSDSLDNFTFPLTWNKAAPWLPLQVRDLHLGPWRLPFLIDDAVCRLESPKLAISINGATYAAKPLFEECSVTNLRKLFLESKELQTVKNLIMLNYAIGEVTFCKWEAQTTYRQVRTGSVFSVYVPSERKHRPLAETIFDGILNFISADQLLLIPENTSLEY